MTRLWDRFETSVSGLALLLSRDGQGERAVSLDDRSAVSTRSGGAC